MRTLPLTVLAHEGPQSRAYLARMRRAGLRAELVILVVPERHPATGKPVGRWILRGLRTRYAERVHELAQNHWPRQIRRRHPALVEAIATGLEGSVSDPASLIEETVGRFRYEDYAERVSRALVAGLHDPALEPLVARSPAVLYTGGGILRRNLLELPGVRFLHVHPGRLPHVRGADGALWSLLARGRRGASCFYMDSGIDTGPVIAADELERPRISVAGLARPDDAVLYRALFAYVDPLWRAEYLVERVLASGMDPGRLSARAQDPGQGLTYHFMHPSLRREALARLFVG